MAIKPVITVNEGAVEMCGKARGSKNSNKLLHNKSPYGYHRGILHLFSLFLYNLLFHFFHSFYWMIRQEDK